MEPTQRKRTLQEVSEAFSLSKDQETALARTIYQHKLEAATASYKQAAHALKVSLPQDWSLPQVVQKRIAGQSVSSSKSISKTYQSLLQSKTDALITDWERSHPETRSWGKDAVYGYLLGQLLDWVHTFMDWKVDQIVQTEISDGLDQGTRDFLDDLTSGDLEVGDPEDLGPGIDLSQAKLAVVPSESSRDFCHEYAGQVFDLSEYDSIPHFPAHPNCIHRLVFLVNGIIEEI